MNLSDKNRLSIKYPSVAKEWNNNRNKGLKPRDISFGSNKKVWWQCKKGHEWEQSIKTRTNGGQIRPCPKCPKKIKRKIKKGNLLFERSPNIALEWNYKRNTTVNPNEVSYSSNKKVWWICSRGHEWEATPNNRINKKSRCPECSYGISQPEMRIFSELSTLFEAKNRYKINKNEIDIYLPDQKIGIEFDGYYWHKDKLKKDKEKNKFFKDIGITIYRIREKPLKKISPFDLIINQNSVTKETINKLLKSLKKSLKDDDKKNIDKYISKKKYVNQSKFNELLSYYPAPEKDKSVLIANQKLAKEWDYEKNKPLKPEMVSIGSEVEVWWKCTKGHKWKKSPKYRNRAPKCPTCIETNNRLDLAMPKVALRWHPSKNGDLKPSDFYSKSSKVVWWKCSDKHECKGAIASRVKGINCTNCPITDLKERKEKRIKNFIKRNNSGLLSKNFDLMKFWDYEKNAGLKVELITENSNQKVWWRCPEGHKWEAHPQQMKTKKNKCSECHSNARKLQKVFPKIAKEFHPTKNKNIKLEDIFYGSKIKIWWRCQQDHEWEMRVNNRTSQGQGCPFCQKNKNKNL